MHKHWLAGIALGTQLSVAAALALPYAAAAKAPIPTSLHGHRLVGVFDRPSSHFLLQLGDAGPLGSKGAERIEVRTGPEGFTANISNVTQVRFYNQGDELQVIVTGRVATASGPRIHPGNVWTINLLAIKG